MPRRDLTIQTLVKSIHEEFDVSQEDLARVLGVSFAMVNRWENGQARSSKSARHQIGVFFTRMTKQGKPKFHHPGA